MALRIGAKLLVNSDAHAPGDLMGPEAARKVALGAGLSEEDYRAVKRNAEELLEKVG